MVGQKNSSQRLELIESLQDVIHGNLHDLFDGSPVSILDFPDIRNCGDSAIWLGEVAYMRKYQRKTPVYTCTLDDFNKDALVKASPEGPIFIHGGGNFGDIWEVHQDFRERILDQFKDRPIIQFPQSIHYKSIERLDKTARAIERHGNFVLLVRDEESKNLSERKFQCEVRLCPDMAFCIGSVPKQGSEKFDVLAMLREDAEKADIEGIEKLPDLRVEDWITEKRNQVRIAKFFGLISGIPSLNYETIKYNKLNAAARQRFNRGVKQLSRARAIVTDRLHVHIVCILLGIPHAVLDNNYGKVRRFMKAFSGGSGLSCLPENLGDGIEWAKNQARVADH